VGEAVCLRLVEVLGEIEMVTECVDVTTRFVVCLSFFGWGLFVR